MDLPVQRWRNARQVWRYDRDEGFRKSDYAADVIPESVAKRFIAAHHYSGTMPPARLCVGLFGPGAALAGVAVFSVPMNQKAVPHYTSLAPQLGVELGRFCLIDEAPYCSETFFLGRAFRLLREEKPEVRAVLSYSDPVPRRSRSGDLVMPGHVGVCYQAGGGRMLGRGSPRTLHMTADGRVLSPRTLSKIRLREQGAMSAERMLVDHGARPRRFGEAPAAWVKDVLASGVFLPIRHPGNWVYAWPLGPSKAERRRVERGFVPALPYPKKMDVNEEYVRAVELNGARAVVF